MKYETPLNPETTWFTADSHYGHERIIGYCDRPFTDANEMNEVLITNWNARVNHDETIFHLGDVAFKPWEAFRDIRSRLNGKVVLIKGNHEKPALEWQRRAPDGSKPFESVHDLLDIKMIDPDAEGGFQHIVLCHYAMRVWNGSFHGSWHIFGHSHGTLQDDPLSLSLDVGVDCWNYNPVSYAEIKAVLTAKKERMAILRADLNPGNRIVTGLDV